MPFWSAEIEMSTTPSGFFAVDDETLAQCGFMPLRQIAATGNLPMPPAA